MRHRAQRASNKPQHCNEPHKAIFRRYRNLYDLHQIYIKREAKPAKASIIPLWSTFAVKHSKSREEPRRAAIVFRRNMKKIWKSEIWTDLSQAWAGWPCYSGWSVEPAGRSPMWKSDNLFASMLHRSEYSILARRKRLWVAEIMREGWSRSTDRTWNQNSARRRREAL